MKRGYLITIFCLAIFWSVFSFPTKSTALTNSGVGGNSAEIDTLNQKITEKRDKIKQLEKSIEEFKQKIDAKRKEAISLSNQISILDNQTRQVEFDIEATEVQLSTIQLEISALDLSIQDKEANIAKQQKMLAELIRTIYLQEDRNYVQIAVTYDNFSDFYNRIQYLENIERNLGTNVRGIKISKSELDEKKNIAAERQVAYKKTNEELILKKKKLEEQGFLKGNLLAQTQSSELKYKTLLASQKSQYQAIEGEIESIEQEVRKKLESQKKINVEMESGGLFNWPVPSRVVTAYFHDPDYPYRNVFEHNGADIRAGQGTPVKAVGSGYIARAKTCSLASCYSYVMIVHSGGLSTVYGHLSSIYVKEDQFVTTGDIIGASGGTPGTVGAGPFVTGPHLHFECRKNGIPVNPLAYLPN